MWSTRWWIQESGMNKSALSRLLRNRSGLIGLALVVLFLAAAVAGALGVSPYPPSEQHARDRMTGPSSHYLLGTDRAFSCCSPSDQEQRSLR